MSRDDPQSPRWRHAPSAGEVLRKKAAARRAAFSQPATENVASSGARASEAEAYFAAAKAAPLGTLLTWPCPFEGAVPRCRVFVPQDARAAYQRLTGEEMGDTDNPFWVGGAEPPQALLQKMAMDPELGFRDLPIGDEAQIERAEALRTAMPNLESFIERVLIALKASRMTRQPLILPPMLLVGEPGTGKSRCARAIAEILGSTFREIAMPSLSGGSATLTGFSSGWKRPRPGLVAEALVLEKSAAPVFFLDEIEKRFILQGDDPVDALHALLEPESARVMRDDGVESLFAAQHALWIASANGTNSMPPSIVDRFDVIGVAIPSLEQMRVIANGIYRDISARWAPWFEPDPPAALLDFLHTLHPRALRRMVQLACSLAASEGRHRVDREHLEAAASLSMGERQHRRFGFL